MTNTTRKKLYLLIVEGGTDEALFQPLITELSNSDVRVYTHRTDIFSEFTTLPTSSQQSIRNRIQKVVKDKINRLNLRPKIISGIIHIVDMDGTFIPNSQVIISPTVSLKDKKRYTTNVIECCDVLKQRELIDRNQRKASNHRSMLGVSQITVDRIAIPYRSFFMSSNTDHIMFNSQNLSIDDKNDLMDDYIDEHIGRMLDVLNHLKQFMINDGDYRETWQHIQQGTNSLNRFTNTPLLFDFIKGPIDAEKTESTIEAQS
ncbi:hypothetical protein [Paenibacillus silagei]|uniref:DUF4276 family protein n=1 Tax=Paenibacillus silagei TaxID=1670801 RepID=A0ABS4NVJ0_9BACL|nr:hypothetical protein [Paenibacillus silagei]MBP2113440.1 hypothetical protein [Paenibacillus silagei]